MFQQAVNEVLQGEQRQREHLRKAAGQNTWFYWHKIHLWYFNTLSFFLIPFKKNYGSFTVLYNLIGMFFSLLSLLSLLLYLT